MISDREMIGLRDKLQQRRNEIVRLQESIRTSWGELQEPEQEFEESASKRTMSDGLEQIDYRTVEELRNIDRALEKMDGGGYGECDVCGRTIDRKRLNAIPWARQCVQCAELEERISETEPLKGEEEADRMPVPMSDEELVEKIWDALESEASLRTEGLEIASIDGVVQLNGFVPDRRQHQLVLEIIEENLGVLDILDHIEVETDHWDEQDDGEPEPD